jgi:Protein phosphatase inhibitor
MDYFLWGLETARIFEFLGQFTIMQRVRAREETPTTGSQTITSNILRQQEEDPSVILHLHAVSNADERRVTWDEEVIDNENMGKKSSKGIPPQIPSSRVV